VASISMNYLADVNVWIALAVVGHMHHSVALAWFEEPQTGQILFSRVTQMGFLRLLTNREVMGPNILTPADAWRVYASLCDDDRVGVRPPDNLELVRTSGRMPIWRRSRKQDNIPS
jgi:toxin-antitoxin system PIN domain toxin